MMADTRKTVTTRMISLLMSLVVSALATGCGDGDDVGDEQQTQSPAETNPFWTAEQECFAVNTSEMPTTAQWCQQNAGEDMIPYICGREPPEVLRATPIDGRDNMYCGCDPGRGYTACPYNINRDR
jgi:hypothetical protein